MENFFERFPTTGVGSNQLPDGSAGVGDIAATAAGNFHLCQQLCGFFIDNDARVGMGFFGSDCREKSGRATTDNCNF